MEPDVGPGPGGAHLLHQAGVAVGGEGGGVSLRGRPQLLRPPRVVEGGDQLVVGRR